MKFTVRDLFNNYFFLTILALPFLEPRCLYDMETMNGIHNIFILWRYYTAIFIIILGLLSVKKITKYCWLMICFQLIFVASTYLNNTGNASYIFRLQITTIGFCILFDLALQFAPIKIINIFSGILALLTVVNLVCIIVFPGGMYTTASLNGNWKSNWLFGFKNLFIFTLLPMLFFVSVRSFMLKRKLDLFFWILLGISAYSVFRTGSVTSGISILFIAILILLFEKRDLTFVLNGRNYMLVSLGLSWALITASIIPTLSNYLAVVNRDLTTMSNRTYIWQNALDCLKSSWLLGYGREVEKSVYPHLGAYHAHNQWLDVLYIGGIVAFAVFIVLFLWAFKNNAESSDIRLVNVINSILLGYFILYLTEARRDDMYIFVILICVSHVKNLVEMSCENSGDIGRKRYVFRFK